LLCSTVSSKKERGGFYGRRRVGNDFGFNTGGGRSLLYIFVHRRNIETRPPRKPRKSSASADTDPDEPEQKMDYRVKDNNSGHSTPPTSNQMVYGYFTK
jgi:hypothetical protein